MRLGKLVHGLGSFRRKMRQRSEEVEIAQTSRAFLDVRLAMMQRILILGVAHASELHEMLGQFRPVLFQKRRPFVGESRV